MPLRVYTIPRARLPVNGLLTFEVDGRTCLVADVEGEIQAFSVVGPSSRDAARGAIVDGRVLCPLHGWPIDPVDGGCAAGTRCRWERLGVETDDAAIRLSVPGR